MLMSADGRLPQQTEAETLRRYLEYMRDDEDMPEERENESRQEEPAGHDDENGAAA
ncbi:hypothetical protein D3C71_1964970 [compost metagenome]